MDEGKRIDLSSLEMEYFSCLSIQTFTQISPEEDRTSKVSAGQQAEETVIRQKTDRNFLINIGLNLLNFLLKQIFIRWNQKMLNHFFFDSFN